MLTDNSWTDGWSWMDNLQRHCLGCGFFGGEKMTGEPTRSRKE